MKRQWPRLAALAGAFAALLACANFEKNALLLKIEEVLELGPLMASVIFVHNALAVSAIAVGMLLCYNVASSLPEPLRRREEAVLRNRRIMAAIISSALIVVSLASAGSAISLVPRSPMALIMLLVASLEWYSTYVAASSGLRGSIGISEALKVLVTLAVAATIETAAICCTLHP